MNRQKWVRATFVLGHKMVGDLNYISRRTGVSKSQFIRELMAEPLADLAGQFKTVPDNPTETDLRQLSLGLLDLIEERAGPQMAVVLGFAAKGSDAGNDSDGGDA